MPHPRSFPSAANEAAPPETGVPPEAAVHGKELAELHRQGAKSAIRRESQESHPMLDSTSRPEATGETEQLWSSRRDAWAPGHISQRS